MEQKNSVSDIVLKDLSLLNEANFHKYFPDKKACHQYLAMVRWNGYMQCPHRGCTGDRCWVYKDGIIYKCKKCRKKFTATTNTLFHGTKIDIEKWYRLMIKMIRQPQGVSSEVLKSLLGFTQTTSWKMIMRMRSLMGYIDDGSPLTDTVQLDQAYFGGKNRNRHTDKKIKYVKTYINPDYKDKVAVQGMLSEDGRIRVAELADETASTLFKCAVENIDPDATLYTDSAKGHYALDYMYNREFINHKKGEYMKDNCTTNGIEAFWHYSKRHRITNIWNSKKYHMMYMQESAMRNNLLGYNFQAKFDRLLLACCNPSVKVRKVNKTKISKVNHRYRFDTN